MKEASQKYVTFICDNAEQSSADVPNIATEIDYNERNELNDNDAQSGNDGSSEENIFSNEKTYASNISIECIACKNNDLPSGAHTCIKCGKNVHIFPECSISTGDTEGYGEKRVCKACSLSNKRKKSTMSSDDEIMKPKKILKSQEATEMNYEEKWDRKRRTKKSKYLEPDSLWTFFFFFKLNDFIM